MRMTLRTLGLTLALLCGNALGAHAQRVHVLIITGLAGEPQYRARFLEAAATLADSTIVWPTLLRLARRSDLPLETRRQAREPSRTGSHRRRLCGVDLRIHATDRRVRERGEWER